MYGAKHTADAMRMEEWKRNEASKTKVVGIVLQRALVCLVDRLGKASRATRVYDPAYVRALG